MIIPSDRLPGLAGLVLLPLSLLAVVMPGLLPAVLVVGGICLLVVVVDAYLGLRQGVPMGVRLPDLMRMQKNRPGELELTLVNATNRDRELVIGLAWPEPFTADPPQMTVRVPSGGKPARIPWSCTAVQRGQYFFRTIWLETGSPWGFWRVRASQPVSCEVRVHPNLLEDRKTAAALFLNRGRLGIHARRQAGKGREFEKLRDYAPGDPLDEVHWKASARRGRLVSKVFQVERTQEVYVIIDASRLSARQDAVERFVNSGLLLALAAEQQGDLFGLMTFDDRVRSFLRANNGMGHFDACRNALYTLTARPVSPDFDEVCATIRTRLRKRALLVFLTALDDPALAESFQRAVALLTGQHLVLVNMLRPVGVEQLFTGNDPDTLDGVYARLAGQLRWSGLLELEQRLRRQGAWFRLLEHEKLAPQLVSQYLEVKGRQLL